MIGKAGRWMLFAGIALGALDLVLITIMPRKPLPPGMGFLMPIGIGLGFFGGLLRKGRKDV